MRASPGPHEIALWSDPLGFDIYARVPELRTMSEYKVGQRWISETEPELGMGIIEAASRHQVQIQFPASDAMRIYAAGNAPIQRVAFRKGDTVRTQSGESFSIDAVEEVDGRYVYLSGNQEVPESELADSLSFSKPEDRLILGQVDSSEAFNLRFQANRHRCASRQSPVAGFAGARIDLIPHQLYIASEVARRLLPRVLLADEVGLGKTIEAGLILHRLHLNGRAGRILILLPETLMHQWFVELLRRFNLWFNLFDPEHFQSVIETDPGINPFLEEQLLLCPIQALTSDGRWAELAAEAGWDLLVVDEAHHLEWSPEKVSPEYQLVESICQKSEGLLLLTATPEQLGADGHFARLRLLDPERYADLEQFHREQEDYAETAALAAKLVGPEELDAAASEQVRKVLYELDDSACNALLKDRKALLEQLIDRHGPGRVIFRNTRDALEGFPTRKALPDPIEPRETDSWDELMERLLQEYEMEEASGAVPDYRQGPRIRWLAQKLRELSDSKVLLICRSPEKVLAIQEALSEQIKVKAAVFHEGLTLVQRDRNAAWFAEPEGARILICSEIGSEGRNFQFAHHLVLFDMPLNPELLEQRIGRLDRIGQTETIRIHVPYLKGACNELLLRWHHEGLNGLEHSLRGGSAYLERFGRSIAELGRSYHLGAVENRADVESLLEETVAYREGLERHLAMGQDQLIALNSCRSGAADALLQKIRQVDDDRSLDAFMTRVFDYYGVAVDDIDERTYRLEPGQLFTEAFPGLPDAGVIATYDRKTALQREEISFLSWDHPMVRGAIDLIIGSSTGNSALVVWDSAPEEAPALLLEAVYILESVAPARLHIDRFLPPTPMRICLDAAGTDRAEAFPPSLLNRRTRDEAVFRLQQDPALLRNLLPPLLDAARDRAREKRQEWIDHALKKAQGCLLPEADRLEALSRINPNVSKDEIRLAREEAAEVSRQINGAHLRLDAVRLILRRPESD